MYYRQAAAALVVYDITKHDTFECAIEWINELIQREGAVVIAFVGNKTDLEDSRAVRTKEAQDFVKTLTDRNVPAFAIECSAKTGSNIRELFNKIGALIVQRAGLQP